MPRNNLKSFAFFLSVLTLSPFGRIQTSIASGHETGNGGTVIIDGETYKLADLSFKALPDLGYGLDDTLISAIQVDEGYLTSLGYVDSNTTYYMDFPYPTSVLDPLNEYHFVGKVPSDCTPVLASTGNPIGCSEGSLTYIVPKYFAPLSLTEKAHLIAEMRMPKDSRRLQLLFGKVAQAYSSDQSFIFFTDDELATLNPDHQVTFVQGGGRILWFLIDDHFYNRDWPSQDDLKTIVMDSKSVILGSSLKANHLTMVNSQVDAFNYTGALVDSVIVNSKIHGDISLRRANIQESQIKSEDIKSSIDGFTAFNSTLDLGPTTSTSVNVDSSVLTINKLTGNGVKICSYRRNPAPFGEPNLSVTADSQVLGDCSKTQFPPTPNDATATGGNDPFTISVGTGPYYGGTPVIVRGQNFDVNTIVLFGGVPCVDIDQISSTEIHCQTPGAPAPGLTVDVSIVHPGGTMFILKNAFTYGVSQ